MQYYINVMQLYINDTVTFLAMINILVLVISIAFSKIYVYVYHIIRITDRYNRISSIVAYVSDACTQLYLPTLTYRT